MKLQNKIRLSTLLVSLALAATAATTAATSTAVSSNTSAALNDKVIKAGTQSANANQQHSDYCKQRYGATATDATNLADVTLGANTTDAVLCMKNNDHTLQSNQNSDPIFIATAPQDYPVINQAFTEVGNVELNNIGSGALTINVGVNSITATGENGTSVCSAENIFKLSTNYQDTKVYLSVDCPALTTSDWYATHTFALFNGTQAKDTGLIFATGAK